MSQTTREIEEGKSLHLLDIDLVELEHGVRAFGRDTEFGLPVRQEHSARRWGEAKHGLEISSARGDGAEH